MINYYFKLAKNILFPLNRSITGNDTRKTLEIIKKEFPKLKIKNFKSGSKVFDWKVPPEWNVKEAYVVDKDNKKIIDFKNNNLHLLGYSVPIKKKISKKNLLKNIYFLKNQPNAIPYITSYYEKRWGFCVSFNQYKKINKKYSQEDMFNVVIKSSNVFSAREYITTF